MCLQTIKSVFRVQRGDNIKVLDDDVTILVSISKKCLISVNIVLVRIDLKKTGIGHLLVPLYIFRGVANVDF